jgi:hypothetical protein
MRRRRKTSLQPCGGGDPGCDVQATALSVCGRFPRFPCTSRDGQKKKSARYAGDATTAPPASGAVQVGMIPIVILNSSVKRHYTFPAGWRL